MELSDKFRSFVQLHGSELSALRGGYIDILNGTAPASVEDAETGTLLLKLTQDGGAFTAETRASGTLTMGGTNGSLTVLTVNGISVIPSAIAFTTETTTEKATAVATAINNYPTFPTRFIASASGAVVTIKCAPGAGTGPNGYVVAATATVNLTATPVNMSGGVAGSGGLLLARSSDGVLSKSGVWSGNILADGVPTYFRYKDSSGVVMAQGTCGLYGSDMTLTSVDFKTGVPFILPTFNLTIQKTI